MDSVALADDSSWLCAQKLFTALAQSPNTRIKCKGMVFRGGGLAGGQGVVCVYVCAWVCGVRGSRSVQTHVAKQAIILMPPGGTV